MTPLDLLVIALTAASLTAPLAAIAIYALGRRYQGIDKRGAMQSAARVKVDDDRRAPSGQRAAESRPASNLELAIRRLSSAVELSPSILAPAAARGSAARVSQGSWQVYRDTSGQAEARVRMSSEMPFVVLFEAEQSGDYRLAIEGSIRGKTAVLFFGPRRLAGGATEEYLIAAEFGPRDIVWLGYERT